MIIAISDVAMIPGGSRACPASIRDRADLGPVLRAVARPSRRLLPPIAGCHRRRDADRVVFEHVVAALVHGSGYERIATPACSDRTIRRRLRAGRRLA